MARARSLSEFQKAFSDEASCVAFLFKRRWPDGFICPGCSERRAAVLKSRPRLYECLDCGRQTSITAGTAMHRSKLPLTAWFWAAHLMATHSNGMSARQLEDQLGVTYKTAWLLTQKLRRSMVDPDREPLEGVVEVDQAEIPFREGDAFFEPGSSWLVHRAGVYASSMGSVSSRYNHQAAKDDLKQAGASEARSIRDLLRGSRSASCDLSRHMTWMVGQAGHDPRFKWALTNESDQAIERLVPVSSTHCCASPASPMPAKSSSSGPSR